MPAGPSDAGRLLSAKLSATDLERLCRDLLVVRGHTDARLMGGTGDGGRDIHSSRPDGKFHIGQSKFHQDPGVTCGTTEMSELPVALMKFGASCGLFITNARCSPQGKREFLNDYPSFELEFLQGEDLAMEVLSSPLLRALWFDGVEITTANATLAIPFIIRRNDDDLPVLPTTYFTTDRTADLVSSVSVRLPQYEISIRTADRQAPDLPGYRPPSRVTMEEGFREDRISVTELVFRGGFALDEVETFRAVVGRSVVAFIGAHIDRFSVLIGNPRITSSVSEPKLGDAAIDLPYAAVGWIQTEESCGEELEWFSFPDSWGLTGETDAHVSEADWIRIYSRDLDVCVAYEIEALPRTGFAGPRELYRQFMQDAWSRSLFALVPSWDVWPYSFPEPDEKVIWPYDNRILCGWMLPGGLVSLPSARQEDVEDYGLLVDKFVDMSALAAAVSSEPGCDLIAADKARYMVAIVIRDPLEMRATEVIRTAEVITYPETLARPIDPSGRRFRVTCAWKTDAAVREVLERVACPASTAEPEITLYQGYVACEWTVTAPASRSTGAFLDEFLGDMSAFLTQLEAELSATGSVERALGAYWFERYGVLLGGSWTESAKQYVWREGSGTPPPGWVLDLDPSVAKDSAAD